MASFQYFDDIREAFAGMISEVGTSCTVSVPVHTTDTWGNLTNTTYTTYTETLWVRQVNETLDITPIGQLNREDIRVVASYDTHIVIEAKITYNGVNYKAIHIDKPDVSGNITHKVIYAKRELS